MRIFSENARKNTYQLVLEIVLIVLILGIIALFLLPVLGLSMSDKESSTKTLCLSNLKQISTAVVTYSEDNNDCLPPHFTFDGVSESRNLMTSLFPYLKNPQTVFTCPSDKLAPPPNIGKPGIPDQMSYVSCSVLKNLIPHFGDGNRLVDLSKDIVNPAQTGYLRDPLRGTGSVKDSKGIVHEKANLSPHGEGFAVAFLDGHAKRMKILDERLQH